ncbi:MAG: hypothetical protein R3E65_08105 [Steroidobacteraceae bacterium]
MLLLFAISLVPPPARAADTAGLLAEIDAFGFHSRMTMGVGGFLTTRIFPVVLFRNGDVLLDVEGLADPDGLEAHRGAHAKAWTRWRRTGGELQLEMPGKGGAREWRKLHFQTTYAKLPAGFRLDGRYRSLKGVGNLAMGGTDSVTAYSEYAFTPDGRVTRGGGVGSTSQAGDISTVTAGTALDRIGRYDIDGLTLRMRWDDGRIESRILVADPNDPKTALWLDGIGYVRR